MLGWRPLLLSWLATLPEGVTQEIKDLILGFFDRMVIPVLQWLRKGGAKVSWKLPDIDYRFTSFLCVVVVL